MEEQTYLISQVLVYLCTVWASLFMHEYGHKLMARYLGYKATSYFNINRLKMWVEVKGKVKRGQDKAILLSGVFLGSAPWVVYALSGFPHFLFLLLGLVSYALACKHDFRRLRELEAIK